ncbi:MAG TPA: HAD family hydrolase [Candidatus Binataceae bacterium]|nr:HAD family hydrolase [Candidatus Binataceae bacterium]
MTPAASRSAPDWRAARVWLFDFDNTLVALEPTVDWAASRIELEAYLRRSGVPEELFNEVPRGNLLLFELLRSRLGGASDGAPGPFAVQGLAAREPRELLRRASAIIEAYELRGAATAAALVGTSALLRRLRAAARTVAIVTSNSSRTVRAWLARHQLDDTVSAMVGRDALLPLKPAPDTLRRALDLCGAAPADAVFVGDAVTDLAAAAAAQVRFLGIAPTAEARARLERAGAAVVGSPAELDARIQTQV